MGHMTDDEVWYKTLSETHYYNCFFFLDVNHTKHKAFKGLAI